jgi:hypothetical protein
MGVPIPRWIGFRGQELHQESISIAWVDVQLFMKVGMRNSRCGRVFRGAICPRCKKTFYICRHCDRGHVYCCRGCSKYSRCENCRVYRRRHRKSTSGQRDHRDREKGRRRRKILGKENVGDHTYEEGLQTAMVSAPVRMAVALAVIGSVGGEETNNDDEVCCEFCGRRARYVYFGNGSTQQRKRGRVFRFSG